MQQEGAKTIPVDRPLSDDERCLLMWLLEHGAPGATGYLSQIPSVRVIGQCSCGCPTLDLAVAGKHGTGGSTIVADFCGTTSEGAFVGVMVHVREDLVSELEAYSLNDIKTFSFPGPESLNPTRPQDEKA
jgi:hypothetical protein